MAQPAPRLQRRGVGGQSEEAQAEHRGDEDAAQQDVQPDAPAQLDALGGRQEEDELDEVEVVGGAGDERGGLVLPVLPGIGLGLVLLGGDEDVRVVVAVALVRVGRFGVGPGIVGPVVGGR